MDESPLERAYRLFKQAARDLELPGSLSPEEMSARLRSLSHQVLDVLEGSDEGQSIGKTVMSELEHQSQEIAGELRRIEELMHRRVHGE